MIIVLIIAVKGDIYDAHHHYEEIYPFRFDEN